MVSGHYPQLKYTPLCVFLNRRSTVMVHVLFDHVPSRCIGKHSVSVSAGFHTILSWAIMVVEESWSLVDLYTGMWDGSVKVPSSSSCPFVFLETFRGKLFREQALCTRRSSEWNWYTVNVQIYAWVLFMQIMRGHTWSHHQLQSSIRLITDQSANLILKYVQVACTKAKHYFVIDDGKIQSFISKSPVSKNSTSQQNSSL